MAPEGGPRDPQNQGPAALERRRRRFKLAILNFIILYYIVSKPAEFFAFQGIRSDGLEGACGPSAVASHGATRSLGPGPGGRVCRAVC